MGWVVGWRGFGGCVDGGWGRGGGDGCEGAVEGTMVWMRSGGCSWRRAEGGGDDGGDDCRVVVPISRLHPAPCRCKRGFLDPRSGFLKKRIQQLAVSPWGVDVALPPIAAMPSRLPRPRPSPQPSQPDPCPLLAGPPSQTPLTSRLNAITATAPAWGRSQFRHAVLTKVGLGFQPTSATTA